MILPQGIALDTLGNLYVVSHYFYAIPKISASGLVESLDHSLFLKSTLNAGNMSILAGKYWLPGSTDGIGSSASIYFPASVAVDTSLNVYVCSGSLRKIDKFGKMHRNVGVYFHCRFVYVQVQ